MAIGRVAIERLQLFHLFTIDGSREMEKPNSGTFDKMLTAESNAIAALRDARVVYQSSNQPREEIERQIER